MSRPIKYKTGKKRIVLEVDLELHRFITDAARMQGKSTKDFLISEVLLTIQGCYVICPKCKKPVIDKRTILNDKIHIQCHNCNHTWHWKIGE